MEKIVILPLLVAALGSGLATFFVIKLAWKHGLIDDPAKHKHPKVIHTKPTPRGGGLGILIGVLVSSLIFLPMDKHLLGILAGAVILVAMGIVDDKYDINPYIRLVVQFCAVAIPIMTGVGITFVTNPLGGGIIDLTHFMVLADLLTIFWIVTIMNFLNWGAKGVDGQLTGVVAIAAFVIMLLSLKFSADITEWPVIILAAITTGAFLGFLPWHIYPQKIMPSFSGSNLGGYLLAILSILTTAKVGTLAVVLGIPLIDSGYTLIRRIGSGKSPFWGDRGHLHHRLLDNGWSKKQVMFFYWGITAILGFISLFMNSQSKLYTMIGLLFFVGGLILWLTYRPKH